ncbi:TPA: hypothetical protein ACH72T_005055, partial [Escherichia coli]
MSVLRDLTQLPDSVLQNPPPIPAWRSPLRKQNKSTIIRLRSFVCIADDAPEKRVNMSSPEYYTVPDVVVVLFSAALILTTAVL